MNKWGNFFRRCYSISPRSHNPVMVNQVLDVMKLDQAVDQPLLIVDATLGAGGHSESILSTFPNSIVIGIDQDPLVHSLPEINTLKEKYADRFIPILGKFGSLVETIENEIDSAILKQIVKKFEKGPAQIGDGVDPELYNLVDVVLFDLGLSSMQLNDFHRGFSFKGGNLNMRMDGKELGSKVQFKDAADLVNYASQHTLANIIYEFGEERRSRHIAEAIVRRRRDEPIHSASDLANVIHSVMPKPAAGAIDSATRTFQALRIYINDELEQIKEALPKSELLLRKGSGKLIAITFHSLEDRIVKNFMYERSGKRPQSLNHGNAFRLPFKKVIVPKAEEINENPRSRSAKLRVAIRTMQR